MNKIKIFSILFLSIFISSCSYIYGEKGVITNRDTDYLKAKSIPPIKIPPGLSSSTMESQYSVSEKQYPENLKKPDLTPPELYTTNQ